MHLCDTFIILDDVPFSKSGYTKRVKIQKDRRKAELSWLTVPIKKYHQHTLINQLDTIDDYNWFDKHHRKLKAVYGGEMYFDKIMGLLEYAISESKSSKLSDINNSIISHVSNYLYVNPKVLMSSDIKIRCDHDDLNLMLVKSVEGTNYISGTGADKYQVVEDFEREKISVSYADIKGFLQSKDGLLANPLGAKIEVSIFDWLVKYSNTEIKEIYRAAEEYCMSN